MAAGADAETSIPESKHLLIEQENSIQLQHRAMIAQAAIEEAKSTPVNSIFRLPGLNNHALASPDAKPEAANRQIVLFALPTAPIVMQVRT